jgi:hypothetical protein
MKKLTNAQLFAGPRSARKTKARIARAKLVVPAAREWAVEMAQTSAGPPSMRRPTVLQRRRLAQRLSAKS